MTAYPFVPKSSQLLRSGDFWAIPLRDGSFACGCVVELMPKGRPGARVGFLGGLLDWHAKVEPTPESIRDASFVSQGAMHILAITSTGGMILGHRETPVEAWTFISGNKINKGFTFVRPWCREDNDRLPTYSTWGYDVISIMANRHFLDGLPSFGAAFRARNREAPNQSLEPMPLKRHGSS